MTQTSNPELPPAIDPLFSESEIRHTVSYVWSLVALGDYADAAEVERTLHTRVLEAIASGTAQAGYLAAAALETRKIAFPRS
jgi:hypothetical protein